MTDIVERLRMGGPMICHEAADEIERLRAERDALLPWGRAMTDIVERLRMQEIADCDEAAEEIEHLRSHVSHLEAHRDNLMAEIKQLLDALAGKKVVGPSCG